MSKPVYLFYRFFPINYRPLPPIKIPQEAIIIILLRKYKPSDCQALAKLFYDTVHIINIADYSEPQVNAWADGHTDLSRWNCSFLNHYTMVAELNGSIVGFGDIDKTGYLDRLYVHHNYQRQKIATALCDKLERSVNIPKITTHASITAQGFFEKRGYKTIKKQQVQRRGIFLTNYIMELPLSQNAAVR